MWILNCCICSRKRSILDLLNMMNHICLVLFPLLAASESARILGVVPTPSYSHQIVFRPIWNELARRGHEVVVITTDPQNNPDLNLTEIDISFAYNIWREKQVIKHFNDFGQNVFKLFKVVIEVFTELTTQLLLHENVQGLLRNETEHFDLVMVEYLLPTMIGFSTRFKCPYIGITSMELSPPYHAVFGNPTHPILYPISPATSVSGGSMNFWQRLTAEALAIMMNAIHPFPEGIETPDMKRLLKKQFGDDMPPLLDLMKNASMMFINENPALSVRPLGPAFVLFGGGTHVTPPKPLPKDLKEYLDSAKDGFIYFSLGTNVKSDVFLPENRKVVLDAFRELPYKVLWKFDVTDIPDVPDNVKIATWLPQQDILRHPNIKVFITQGGLQSTEETIFSHVPIVGIPYVADQEGNVKKLVAKGGGVILNKNSLTKESVKEAVLEVIKNPKYKESVTELAELSRDQPMTGIEKAVWWTEFVIRHKGASHLRSPAIDLPVYQYYFLDIIGFLLAVISVFLFVSYKSIVFIKKRVTRYFASSKKLKSQ